MSEIVPWKIAETVSFLGIEAVNTGIDVPSDIISLAIPMAKPEIYRMPIGFGGLTSLGTFVDTGSESPEPSAGSAQASQENWYLS